MHNPTRNNWEKSLRKAILFSQLFGIFPLKLNPVGFSITKPLALTSVCSLIVISYFTIVSRKVSDERVPFVRIVSAVNRITSLGYMAALIVIPMKYVELLNNVFDNLRYIDAFISQRVSFVDNVTISLTFLLILSELFIYSFYMLFSSHSNWALFFTCLFFIVSHASECQFIGVFGIFLHRFRALNRCLKKVQLSKDILVKEVIFLSNIHFLLSESLFKINKIYSLQFLISTIIIFLRLIIFPFGIYSATLLYYVYGPHAILWQCMCWYWLLLSFWGVVRLVTVMVNITNEAKEFHTLLYQLMLDDGTNLLSNNKKLSLHIAMKREVVFTACGFFTLDYTLVHSMVAAATTYLVILIQFGQPRSSSNLSSLLPNSTDFINVTSPSTTIA